MDNITFAGLKDQISNLTLYDVKAAARKAQNVVMNYTEMEAKTREATNNEPWGASTTLMNELANGTYNYQQLNEIMPMIYKRFTEKSAEEWRQIYKALQLLEYLVKNGSERVVDDARQHVGTIKMLKQFHYIDPNGKDQGLNVRNRAKELGELLGDVDRIRTERKKAKASRNKYQGVEGGAGGRMGGGMTGGFGTTSRYGGFGSEELEFGGYSGGVYGDGGGFGGQSSTQSSTFQDTNSRSGSRNQGRKFEEYDEYDDGAIATPARRPGGATTTQSSTRQPVKSKTPPPEPKKAAAPVVDLLFDDGPAPMAPPKPAANISTSSALDDDFGGFKQGDDDDEFDDFQSGSPISPPVNNTFTAPISNTTFAPPPQNNSLSMPSMQPLSASTIPTFVQPQPVSASQNVGLNDIMSYKSASPAPSMSSTTSAPIRPIQPASFQPAQPNYFQSVPTGASSSTINSTLSPTTTSSTSANILGKTGSSTSLNSTGGAKKNDAFGSLWSSASMQAGIKKPATPTSSGTSMAAMAKEKASAGIWGTTSSSSATSSSNNNSFGGNKPATGNGLDDLLF